MKQNGFTLLEMMVVIAVIGLIVVMTTISYRKVQDTLTLDLAISSLEKDLLTMKDQARFGVNPSVCRGLLFQVGSGVEPFELSREAPPKQGCKLEPKLTENEKDAPVIVSSLLHDGVPRDQLFLFAESPDGTLKMLDAEKIIDASGMLKVTMTRTSAGLSRTFSIDLFTGTLIPES